MLCNNKRCQWNCWKETLSNDVFSICKSMFEPTCPNYPHRHFFSYVLPAVSIHSISFICVLNNQSGYARSNETVESTQRICTHFSYTVLIGPGCWRMMLCCLRRPVTKTGELGVHTCPSLETLVLHFVKSRLLLRFQNSQTHFAQWHFLHYLLLKQLGLHVFLIHPQMSPHHDRHSQSIHPNPFEVQINYL